jgi:hypothetical protein
MWLTRLVLNEEEERGTLVPHGLHATVAALFTSSCGCRFPQPLNKATSCLFPCLQGVADALPGAAKKQKDVNQSVKVPHEKGKCGFRMAHHESRNKHVQGFWDGRRERIIF